VKSQYLATNRSSCIPHSEFNYSFHKDFRLLPYSVVCSLIPFWYYQVCLYLTCYIILQIHKLVLRITFNPCSLSEGVSLITTLLLKKKIEPSIYSPIHHYILDSYQAKSLIEHHFDLVDDAFLLIMFIDSFAFFIYSIS
jgi:hypothetical protein